MEDMIQILSPIPEWIVFQHHDGSASIRLSGVAKVNGNNYPILRVVDVNSEKTVLYQKLPLINSEWQTDVSLEAGSYRIETGIALEAADYNPYYLARGDIWRHLFVGDVFVIAGQSNASGYGRGAVDDPPQYGVSMLSEKWSIAAHPVAHLPPGFPNTDFLNSGHSAWIKLGKLILSHQKMPVGLVPVALNGSGIDLWAPGTPLFEHMIKMAKQSGAAHLIWYQGCTDTNNPTGYEEKLKTLIETTREKLGDLEIYLVQISGTKSTAHSDEGWRLIREAQRKVAVELKTFLIPTYDFCHYSDDIHLSPNDNLLLAQRLFSTYVDKKKNGSVKIRKGKTTELIFDAMLQPESVNHLVVLDKEKNKINCHFQVRGNTVKIIGDPGQMQIVTLPFGRLYKDQTLRYVSGDPVPYFYLDLHEPEDGQV